jgi:cytochrome b561
MSALSTRLRYGSVAQAFHWLTVILVVAAYILGEGGPESRVFSDENLQGLTLHETAGILVLVLLVARLVWRAIDRRPEEVAMPGWMSFASKAVHLVLYLLLAALPITGVLGSFLEGHPVHFLGLGAIGPLTAEAHATGDLFLEVHETLGNVILWVAGLHALAALYHHYIVKDRVLSAMLPWGREAKG